MRMIVALLGTLALTAPAAAMAEGQATTSETTTATQSTPQATTPTGTEAAPAPLPTQTTTSTAPTTTTTTAPEVKTQAPQAQSVPRVERRLPQGASGKAGSSHKKAGQSKKENEQEEKEKAAGHKPAPAPSTLTPPLPSTLSGSLQGVPNFFLNSFSIPPFLLPIYQAAGTAYGIPWQVLAAINEVETDYGRDLSVSSAGAEGWMQFMPGEWERYGVDVTAQGYEDPYNPADAIFAAARYLKAAGGDQNIKAAIFAYNHSQAYVASVMLRAQLLGGTPSGLLSAITGLTEARFPVHAAAHFSDGFQSAPAGPGGTPRSIPGTTIYSEKGAPVIAVQDGVITKIGESPALGKFISLKDAFGNTYTYAQLGSLATLYPVLELRGHSSAALAAQASPESDPAPNAPASAGVQPRSPLSAASVTSTLALGAAGGIGTPASAPASRPPAAPASPAVRQFRAGADEVYLHRLKVGAQVIAGTVLGHLGEGEASGTEPHMLFQIRPSGVDAPLIDPKPILDGWVLLEDSSVYKAKGADPFAQTKPSAGQVLLESKNQLEQQVLANPKIHIYSCGRGDIQTGKVDRRVLAVLEFLSVSGLQPSVSALRCHERSGEYLTGETVNISAINGVPVAGHSGPGSLTARAIARLLDLQGTVRPLQLSTPTRHPQASNTLTARGPYTHIHLSFASLYARDARLAKAVDSELSPDQWIKLIARLGQIPNPTVANGPSQAAIPDPGTQAPSGATGQAGASAGGTSGG